jgi:hypothetical protein
MPSSLAKQTSQTNRDMLKIKLKAFVNVFMDAVTLEYGTVKV